MEQEGLLDLTVIWREKKMSLIVDRSETLGVLSNKLHELTGVNMDTIRLLVPTRKSSRLINPFSDAYASLSLQGIAILEGRPIRMMGVFDAEIEEVSSNSKKDPRIAGFEEEERRLRQRSNHSHALKLPTGTYIFCNFRTLHIQGLELNPPASEALRRMHMLACDPGIIAIMNKYQWRVGVMTEMAPIGYVGITPKCILGYNKNCGEEISLRLRTDDLMGFRKYESIKQTLLHELAHMVHSEHDANFYALDKQLNEEAVSLNWTKSRSYFLSYRSSANDYCEDDPYLGASSNHSSQKLGGTSDLLANARSASVAAAYHRFFNNDGQNSETSVLYNENQIHVAPNSSLDVTKKDGTHADAVGIISSVCPSDAEPDPDDYPSDATNFEPYPDNSIEINSNHSLIRKVFCHSESTINSSLDLIKNVDKNQDSAKSYLDDPGAAKTAVDKMQTSCMFTTNSSEPDPDDSDIEPNHDDTKIPRTYEDKIGMRHIFPRNNSEETPDPDDHDMEQMPDNSQTARTLKDKSQARGIFHRNISEGPYPDDDHYMEHDTDDSQVVMVEDTTHMTSTTYGNSSEEPDTDDFNTKLIMMTGENKVELDSDRPEMADDSYEHTKGEGLEEYEDPVAVLCARLRRAIIRLKTEAVPHEDTVLQTLFTIIRNLIEHPVEMKFRKLRKANHQFQKNVANYNAAMEILTLIGFSEEVIPDEIGRMESYMVLKRNDPGLLWLAKSSLEMSIL